MKDQKEPFLTCGIFAFTLVEIALSLGIASFALIGILGIIPIAVASAKEAHDETRATLIALTIIETFRSGSESEGTIQVHPGPDATDACESIPLQTITGTVTYDLAYDLEGAFLGRMASYNYSTGEKTLPGTIFIARLILQRDAELLRTEVSVETPATASEANRKTYSYVTFVKP